MEVPIYKIRKLTEKEELLGMAFYTTHWTDFIGKIWEIRHALDDIWERDASEHLSEEDVALISSLVNQEKKRCEQKTAFPKGYCFHITSIFEKFLRTKIKSNECWIGPFKEYINHGGFFRKVWGIDKEIYFQTALQIGPIILDVSYNTVNIIQAKVDWQLLGLNCVFREVRDLEDYLLIKIRYQGIDVFHNTVFPEIYENFPVLYYDREHEKYFLPMEKIFERLLKETKNLDFLIKISKNLNSSQKNFLTSVTINSKLFSKNSVFGDKLLPGLIQKALKFH